MDGVGVLLANLGGNEESVDAYNQSLGKTITEVKIHSDRDPVELVFTFDDDTKMALFDDGQSCCESRYMNCDDDLSSFAGSKFMGAEVREGATKEEHGEPTDSEFLIITTDKGSFTVVNYNEHNGYYGGFAIRAKLI